MQASAQKQSSPTSAGLPGRFSRRGLGAGAPFAGAGPISTAVATLAAGAIGAAPTIRTARVFRAAAGGTVAGIARAGDAFARFAGTGPIGAAVAAFAAGARRAAAGFGTAAGSALARFTGTSAIGATVAVLAARTRRTAVLRGAAVAGVTGARVAAGGGAGGIGGLWRGPGRGASNQKESAEGSQGQARGVSKQSPHGGLTSFSKLMKQTDFVLHDKNETATVHQLRGGPCGTGQAQAGRCRLSVMTSSVTGNPNFKPGAGGSMARGTPGGAAQQGWSH